MIFTLLAGTAFIAVLHLLGRREDKLAARRRIQPTRRVWPN